MCCGNIYGCKRRRWLDFRSCRTRSTRADRRHWACGRRLPATGRTLCRCDCWCCCYCCRRRHRRRHLPSRSPTRPLRPHHYTCFDLSHNNLFCLCYFWNIINRKILTDVIGNFIVFYFIFSFFVYGFFSWIFNKNLKIDLSKEV